jgi:hypothetical protein
MNQNTVLGLIIGLVIGFALGWFGCLQYEKKKYDYHLNGPGWELRGNYDSGEVPQWREK